MLRLTTETAAINGETNACRKLEVIHCLIDYNDKTDVKRYNFQCHTEFPVRTKFLYPMKKGSTNAPEFITCHMMCNDLTIVIRPINEHALYQAISVKPHDKEHIYSCKGYAIDAITPFNGEPLDIDFHIRHEMIHDTDKKEIRSIWIKFVKIAVPCKFFNEKTIGIGEQATNCTSDSDLNALFS